jgi:hypothetical protein
MKTYSYHPDLALFPLKAARHLLADQLGTARARLLDDLWFNLNSRPDKQTVITFIQLRLLLLPDHHVGFVAGGMVAVDRILEAVSGGIKSSIRPKIVIRTHGRFDELAFPNGNRLFIIASSDSDFLTHFRFNTSIAVNLPELARGAVLARTTRFLPMEPRKPSHPIFGNRHIAI